MENTAPCQVWKLKDKFRAHRAETGRTDNKRFTFPLVQLKMNVRIGGGYLDVVLFGDVGEINVDSITHYKHPDGTNPNPCWGYLDNRAPFVSTKTSNNPFPFTLHSQTPRSVF